MEDANVQQALEVLSGILKLEVSNRFLGWDSNLETLAHDDECNVIWRVQPSVGGPVRIACRALRLERADGHGLADIATDLCETGEQVALHSWERFEAEREISAKAKTLLRRKAAKGIRLARVECAPIPTDAYQNIGMDVTFEYERRGSTMQHTVEVGDVDELTEEFEKLVVELQSRRLPSEMRIS